MIEPNHVVALRPGALGDALLAFPALAWLRRAWPNTRVTLVARSDVLSLATATGLADTTATFDDPVWAGLWGDAAGNDPRLRGALGAADAAVAWLSDADGAVYQSLRACAVQRIVVAPGRPEPPTHDHVALHLARTLAGLGLDDLPSSLAELRAIMLTLTVPPEAERKADALWSTFGLAGERVVALHPGSGGARKCWPAERFAAIARRLRAEGSVPLIIEGPADAEVVARLLAMWRAQEAHDTSPLIGDEPTVARELAVAVLAGMLARCAGYVGNDSGVSHLAGQVGCPTLALFGPSDPATWAPIGRNVRTVRAPSGHLDALIVEAVWTRLRTML